MAKGPTPAGVRFFKLHGAGNDVLVVHAQDISERDKPAFIRRFAHRQLGVGSDQVVELLSLEPLAIQIWNGDGTKTEMCVNGSRSFLFLAAIQGWVSKGKAVPLLVSGQPCEGTPTEGGSELCLTNTRVIGRDVLKLNQRQIPFWEVNTGNPHAVVLLGKGQHTWEETGFSYLELGPQIEAHPRFPQKTNVEFVHSWVRNDDLVEAVVEVWERGAGATLSCGSGAIAVAAVLSALTGSQVFRLKMTDFWLEVRLGEGKAFLSGPCALIAEGRYFGQ